MFPLLAAGCFACTSNKTETENHDTWCVVRQSDGPDLGFSKDSGMKILNVDGYAFKDLNGNGILDPYEDWRLPVSERAADLASRMTLEEICGLMLYSSAVRIYAPEPTQDHLNLLDKDNIRHMLVADVADARTAAAWSNAIQAHCEKSRLGIPSNNSSDPRNYTNGTTNVNNYRPEPDGEFDPSGESDISKWPREIGMAATFDMDVIRKHGEMVSEEYRALGITTALSPQIDIATDPRWRRFYGTFSEDPVLCRDIAQVYCEAFQTTPGSRNGWGMKSVNCMVKHWPGGGSGEGGRDAHFGIGKYAVYPGGRFDLGLIPFTEGAFKLPGKTGMASAVMPYYTISYNQDPSGENVGNGFSRYIIQQLLRNDNNYEGVVCTDWGIVNDYQAVYRHKGTPWGMETSTPAERRLKCFEAGVDQLGGAKDNDISIEAYRLWEAKYGKESARERFELSARRLLTNIFNVGIFENPYVDPSVTAEIVGCKEFVAAGYDAQLKSIVMLKNAGQVLPADKHLKVYEPLRHVPAGLSHWQKPTPEYDEYPISKELLGKYYEVVETPEEADIAIVSIRTPVGHWGYVMPDEEYPEGHYQPISLQWSPYTATDAREKSIAGGDPTEKSDNRSYKGYTEHTTNVDDMYLVQNTKKAMGDKPVIVIVATERPFVPTDIEPWSDAILINFGVSNNALLDIISGAAEPYGLLPCQLPADMKTVEEQCEDVPRDMKCYVDSEGNTYDFAFGLDWKGRIMDKRVKKYLSPSAAPSSQMFFINLPST